MQKIFHPKYRGCSANFPAPLINSNQKYLKFCNGEEIGKDDVSRKDAKTPSSGDSEDIFSFAPWRLGEIHFP
jgi:hypothetical protein